MCIRDRELRRNNARSRLKCLISNYSVLEFFRELSGQMRYIQQHAWAPSTLKSLASQWKAFQEFCGLANITMLPIPDHIICFFAVWLISSGRVSTQGSLAQYVSCVRTVHKMLRLPQVPTPSQYGPLDMILKGTRRLAQHRTKKSLPVSPPILANLLQSEIPSHFGHIYQQTIQVYRYLCLLYFLTMLRSSNLIAKSLKSIDLKMILCWEDVKPLRNNINTVSYTHLRAHET